MKQTKIAWRLAIITLVMFVGVIAVATTALLELRTQIESERERSLRSVVDVVASQIDGLAPDLRSGRLTRDGLIQKVRSIVSAARYDGNNYFFVWDWDGTILADRGTPQNIGKNLLDKGDVKGTLFRKEIVDKAQQTGSGVVTYYFPRAGQTEPLRKKAFVIGLPELKLIVASGMYVDDLEAAFGAAAFRLGGFMLLIVLVSGAFTMLVARSISRPLVAMDRRLREMVAGDLDGDIPGLDRRDEIGRMASSVAVLRDHSVEVVRLRKLQEEGERQAAETRRIDMNSLADRFEQAVGEVVEAVSSASTELEASAKALRNTADHSENLTGIVADASGVASTNVQSVAAATEQLSSSINEISRQVLESARISSEAVGQAQDTNKRVSELSEAAGRIGDVVELINGIAGQTNLLALNATIEAARAGEAGRGFAVVASEVKALAEQTAKATGEIGQQISGIQAATQESVAAIKAISNTIERLSGFASAISAAVEEQHAATKEISRNVQHAAEGTHQVSANIADVKRGATDTGAASAQVLSAAQTLSVDSEKLRSEIGHFLSSVRAA
ncbi:methyl-accepting chemotaxis protein [Bradyrhizobium diazoefficiens]